MESNWAAENLQTIRTLMERSAVYRRALAPIATFTGSVGIIAAGVGYFCRIESTRAFALFWMVASIVAISGSFLRIRRQALKDGEAFWSPPARRVAQAMFPGLFIGMVAGILFIVYSGDAGEMDRGVSQALLIIIWSLAYGCALHSGSFFTPRGVRLFSWFFIIAGLGILVLLRLVSIEQISRHWLMGILFGASHLAYGIYLYFTEPRKNET
jgi:hypothetical protein